MSSPVKSPAPAPEANKVPYTPTQQTQSKKRARDSLGGLLLHSPQKKLHVPHVSDPDHREKIVEFLSECAEDFGLKPMTAALATTYFDRWMSVEGRKRFSSDEVVALSCLFVAAKQDDVCVPTLSQLCNVPEKPISRSEMKEAELDLIRCLDWRLHHILPHAFLEQFSNMLELTVGVSRRATFLTDMSYYEHRCLPFSPCVVALASVVTALKQFCQLESAETKRNLKSLCLDFEISRENVAACAAILETHFNTVFGVGFNAPHTGASM